MRSVLPGTALRRAVFAAATLVAGLILLSPATSVAGSFNISNWEAGTCAQESCKDAGSPSAFYTQVAGHPDFGITDFSFSYETGLLGAKIPNGHVKDVRVDLPPGLAVNPEATAQCSQAQIDAFKCPEDSKVGEDEATGTVPLLKLLGLTDLTVTERFPVYDMERNPGESARFGVEVNSPTLELLAATGHDLRGQIYLHGGISWHEEAETSESSGVKTGDFHEFFRILEIPKEPEIIESKLIFWGVPHDHVSADPPRAFITLPSKCAPQTTYLHVDSWENPGNYQAMPNTTPVAATGCGSLPFSPSLTLIPETTQSDQPDGASINLRVPLYISEPSRPSSPDVQRTEVQLPEGMTLNPSAANGLQACTNAQFALGTDAKIECPAASKIGSVEIDAPGIPNGSLGGSVYVATPEPNAGPESGNEYRVFIAAEAPQYDVGVRLEGHIVANTHTGRLTANVSGTPEVPFEDFTIHLNGGPRAPLANPLSCGAAEAAASITPYSGQPAAGVHTEGFVVDANGGGGGCSSPLPFSLSQSTFPQIPTQAGAYAPFDFSLSRAEGQQYLSSITTTLPAGVAGAIPSVPLCGEAEANAGTCQTASQIGTVNATVGAGSEPYGFSGRAYLTGPYGGDPYGLSIVVPVVAGPYNLGEIVTRAGIGVGLYSGRVTVTSTLPSVVGGVPLRLRGLSVSANRPNFTFNPTSCSSLQDESQLVSTFGANQILSSPFQVGGCNSLAFAPRFSVASGGRTSKAHGASIVVKIAQAPHEANLREVLLQLPKQLPSRLTTIQKACPAASFEAGMPPGTCPEASQVGAATVVTPVLQGRLSGPAYLVSHGGAAFPDLDVVLRGDGLEVVLVGHTHISSSGITTSDFQSLPDVPIESAVVDLPTGPNSALAQTTRSLCSVKLLAPTTLVAQNGVTLRRMTRIAVTGCARTKSRAKKHRRRGRVHQRTRSRRSRTRAIARP